MLRNKILKPLILLLSVLMLSACTGHKSGLDDNTTTIPQDPSNPNTPPAHSNTAPIAHDLNVTIDEDTPVSFSATDADGDTLSYTITQQPSHGTIDGNTYTPDANYHGTDRFTFKAYDGHAYSKEATVTIIINPVNDAPVAHDQNLTTDEDTASTFTLSGSDVDGDDLNYTITQQPSHGTIDGNTYTPDANYNGTDSFTFKASDGTLDSAEATVTITINPVNDAPIAHDQNLTTDEDTASTFTLSGSDVDGDDLNYTITQQPSHGAIDGNTYTPDANYYGNDRFKFKACDGHTCSKEATVTITINPVNDAPTATAQSVELDEDNTTSITLSGEDVDGDTPSPLFLSMGT